jgi:hypothetical protein
MVVLVCMAQRDKNRTHRPETRRTPIGPEKSGFSEGGRAAKSRFPICRFSGPNPNGCDYLSLQLGGVAIGFGHTSVLSRITKIQ